MSDFIKMYLSVVNILSLKIMVSLIGVDLLLGIILAAKNHEFTFQKLADYLVSDGVPFIVYIALGFPAMFMPELATVLLGIGATLIAALLAMVLDKAAKLLGFPVPKVLKE